MADKRWIGTDGNAATNANWSPANVPTTGDNVTFPAGGGSVSSGLSTMTGVVLGTVKIEKGYTGTIGVISSTALTYLQFECARLEVDGTGTYALNIETSNISPIVRGTATPATGYYGCYLTGSNIATLNTLGGSTVVAGGVGGTSTLATLRVSGDNTMVALTSGVTLTTSYVLSGTLTQDCACTTLTQSGGKVTTTGTGAITTVNARGGITYLGSSGTITTLNLDGGEANFSVSNVARTVTTTNIELPSRLVVDASIVTMTNLPAVTGLAAIQFSKA